MPKKPTKKQYRAYVRDNWHEEGVVEIDDNAKVSCVKEPNGNGEGAYVQAWIWVYDSEVSNNES